MDAAKNFMFGCINSKLSWAPTFIDSFDADALDDGLDVGDNFWSILSSGHESIDIEIDKWTSKFNHCRLRRRKDFSVVGSVCLQLSTTCYIEYEIAEELQESCSLIFGIESSDMLFGLSNDGFFYSHDMLPSPFCAKFVQKKCAMYTVGVMFDGVKKRLGFVLDGQWIGWALLNLPLNVDIFYRPVITRRSPNWCIIRVVGVHLRNQPHSLQFLMTTKIAEKLIAEYGWEAENSVKIGGVFTVLVKTRICELLNCGGIFA